MKSAWHAWKRGANDTSGAAQETWQSAKDTAKR